MSSFVSPNDLLSRTIANIVPGTILLPIGLLLTGWTTQARVFWLVPDVVSDMNCMLLVGVTRSFTGHCDCWGWHYCVIPKHPGVFDRFIYTVCCFWCGTSLTVIGFCMLTYFLVTTALAAATFLRSMAGFGFPLFAPAMYRSLGYGKGDTVLAVVAIVLGCPACVKSADYFFAHT